MEKMKSPIELSFSVEMSLFLWLFRHGKALEFRLVRSYKWRINAMEETFLSLILKNVILPTCWPSNGHVCGNYDAFCIRGRLIHVQRFHHLAR